MDTPAAALVVGSLATWRVSTLLVSEDGPGQAVVRLRTAVDGTPLAGVLDCFGCTSVWVGIGTAATLRRSRSPLDLLVTGLALSGAAWFAESALRALTDRGSPDRPPPDPDSSDWLPEPTTDSPLVSVER